ncbi:hypothetical protein IVB38_28310 [Bradyrhizobium sp. 38]|uniref:hypothetical protein n=1 Tax=unclassified Bradyrhizobium TaxID=2631580 RepID=UPI001FF7D888|nr:MULTISPECIES: hypothetical protein [unclassified Bradyrhizobium]MCK1339800.1 hypothetical protein [Bradyrhizobium sp. 38]MCK1782731.1 hypothetical protein [Bradyrhizobium sp. 132]
MSRELVIPSPNPIGSDADDLENELRQSLDQLARRIGRSAVHHLKTMYPAALSAVPKNAEISVANYIRNQINFEMRPVIEIAMKQWRQNSEG